MTDTSMTCERLEELLPDYLDGALGEPDRLAVERHLAGCPACGPLVADVHGIVLEAGALPVLRPSRDLWAGIEARIATPVVNIGAGTAAAPVRRSRFASRGWLAAAAVLLVVTTAGITYEVTRRMQDVPTIAQTNDTTRRTPSADAPDSLAAPVQQVADAGAGPFAPPPPDPDAGQSAPAPQRPATDRRPRAESPRPASLGTQPRATTPSRVARTTPEARLVGGESSAASAASPIERAYAKELADLATMVRERRGELDPATVAVLEHSLKVIDEAIAQSKEALQRDPASGFLQEQLGHALDKKVTLLRTAARLPART